MPRICVSELGQRLFRLWLVVYSAPSHYLNQFWSIVNWTIENKFQWNFNQNTKLFIHENASENIVCETVAMLSRGRWAKSGHWCADAINRLSSVLVVIFPTLCLFTKFVGSTPIAFPVNMIQMFRNDINSMSLMSKFLVVIIHRGGVCGTVWCQTIIWSSVGLLLIGPWEKISVIFWLNYNFQTPFLLRHDKIFQNIVCKMTANLPRPQYASTICLYFRFYTCLSPSPMLTLQGEICQHCKYFGFFNFALKWR